MEVINIDKDSILVIDTKASDIDIRINNCKVTITDISNSNKNIYVHDGKLDYSYVNKGNDTTTNIEINGGSAKFNVIDVLENSTSNNYVLNLEKENSEATFNLVSIARKEDTKAYTIKSNNNIRDTKVVINCFGISENKGVNHYDVTSFIKKGAKKSVVNQNSKVLLFDKESKGINNPILEIEENDVKANHGSSIGMIDEDTLFYLTSRGIDDEEARRLVSIGRVHYLIDEIRDEKVKEDLFERLERK